MKLFVKLLLTTILLNFSFLKNGNAQTFLNGDFEINTAGVDQINLGNAAFNGFMPNTIAFGSFGDMDIIQSATYCGLAQNGLWYTALTGSGTDAITMQLSAPLVVGTCYTITFWDKGCVAFSSSTLPIELGVATAAGTFGTPVYTGPTPTDGVWTMRTATFIAPVAGAFISVQMPTGGLSDWTQIDNFTIVPCTAAPPVTNFSTSDNNICEADCISFTDLSTNTPTSWNWTFTGGTPATSTVQNPSSICYATAGTYPVTLTSTNASGSNTLTQTSYITVNPIDDASFSYGATSYCQTGPNPTPTITGTPGGAFTSAAGLSITGATGTINLAASTPGTYTITYTTPGACPATSTASITISATTVATFNYAGPYCQNATDPSPTLGAGASAGTFSSTAGLSINATTGVVDLSASTPGTYTITNSIAASGSCPAASATATITIDAVPTPVISGTSTICSGASTTLTANGGTTFTWNTGSTLASITVSPGTTTTYTVTASNAGCTATATQTVTVTPPATTAISSSICQGNSYTLPSGTPVTVSGVYVDTLSMGSGCDSIVTTTLTVTPPPVGTVAASICTGQSYTLPSGTVVSTAGTYNETITAAGGCDSVVTTTLTITPPPVGTVAASICAGQTYTLPSGTIVSTAGTYSETVTAAGGCDSIVTTTLTIAPPPIGTVNATICAGQNYTLPDGTIVGNPGMYSDTVSAAGGCDSIITTNLTVNSATAFAGLDDIIDYGSSTNLTATGGVSYSWSPSTGLSSTSTANTTASPLATTSYTVTVTNANGCTASDIVVVYVDLPPCGGASVDLKTLIPNAFSPNDDGINDGLCIPVNPCIAKITLNIYDRWGELVYESSSLDECWDGLYKGKKLDSAVFAYYFKVVFIDGTTGTGKGNISLIR